MCATLVHSTWTAYARHACIFSAQTLYVIPCRTGEHEQAIAIVERVRSNTRQPLLQHVAKEVKQRPTERGRDVHDGVKQRKGKPAVGVGGVALDGDGHDGNTQRLCHGGRAQQGGDEDGAGGGEGDDGAGCSAQGKTDQQAGTHACIVDDWAHEEAKDGEERALMMVRKAQTGARCSYPQAIVRARLHVADAKVLGEVEREGHGEAVCRG